MKRKTHQRTRWVMKCMAAAYHYQLQSDRDKLIFQNQQPDPRRSSRSLDVVRNRLDFLSLHGKTKINWMDYCMEN